MARKKRRRTKDNAIVGIFSKMILLASAAMLMLSYMAMFVNPVKAWFMTGIGLLFVPLAVLNVLLLAVTAKNMSKSLFIPLIALIPSLIFIGRYLQFSSGGEEPEPQTIKMVSYNVGQFRLGKGAPFKEEGGHSACLDSVSNFILNQDADIVCLQEVGLDSSTDIKEFLKKHFPGYNYSYYIFVSDSWNFGNVTLSRFPIEDKGVIGFEKSTNLAIWTDIRVEDKPVRIYNCHLQSYNISIPKVLGSLGKDSTLVHETEEKMKKSIRLRPEQVEKVMRDIEDSPRDAIVAGDFNDSPMSYTYYRMMKGHQDTFVEAGKGFGATYSPLWPFIRIDYILVPKSYSAVSYRIPHEKMSDHYPAVAEFTIKDE